MRVLWLAAMLLVACVGVGAVCSADEGGDSAAVAGTTPSFVEKYNQDLAAKKAFVTISFCERPPQTVWLESESGDRVSVTLSSSRSAFVALAPGSYRFKTSNPSHSSRLVSLAAATNTYFGPCSDLPESVLREFAYPLAQLPLRWAAAQ